MPIVLGGAIAIAGSVTATAMANRNALKLFRLETMASMQGTEAQRIRDLFAKVLATVVSVRAAVESRGDFGENMLAMLGMTRLEYEARLRLEQGGIEIVTGMDACYDLAMSYQTHTRMYMDLAAKGESDADEYLKRRNTYGDELETALDGLEKAMRVRLDVVDATSKRADAAVPTQRARRLKWRRGSPAE